LADNRGVRCVLTALRRDDRGQALVEIAIALPILMLILFGIIEFGEAINYYNDETNIANVAARYAVVGGSPACGGSTSTISAYDACIALQESGALGNGVSTCVTDLTTASDTAGSQVKTGDSLEVKLTYNWSAGQDLPFLGFLGKIPITSSATMRVEDAPSSTFLPTGALTANGC
jgi:Flp pilus assembly protein TadG